MEHRRQESVPTIGLHVRIPMDLSLELTKNVQDLGTSKTFAVLEAIRLWNKMAEEELRKESGDQKVG